MSNIKALGELRGIAKRMDDMAAERSEHGFSPLAISIKNSLVKVEDEIAKRFMELPVDADGVPVRIGDTMERICAEDRYVFTVGLIGANGYCMDDETSFFKASECRHVQPDTVESLLKEFALATDYAGDWNNPDDADERQQQVDALANAYAERIRKAVEHGD